jgi:hypothetical protein
MAAQATVEGLQAAFEDEQRLRRKAY